MGVLAGCRHACRSTRRVTTKAEAPIRPVDRQIADVARARGDVYTLDRTADNAPHPAERRPRELERLGLATPEPAHRWKVSPNLLQELVERQCAQRSGNSRLIHSEQIADCISSIESKWPGRSTFMRPWILHHAGFDPYYGSPHDGS
jgi:hypothetical protein